jgi:hypothetical protein
MDIRPTHGGPAFPIPTDDWRGMTLRDWFAGQALMGKLAYCDEVRIGLVAEEAYMYADAMLAQREVPND